MNDKEELYLENDIFRINGSLENKALGIIVGKENMNRIPLFGLRLSKHNFEKLPKRYFTINTS